MYYLPKDGIRSQGYILLIASPSSQQTSLPRSSSHRPSLRLGAPSSHTTLPTNPMSQIWTALMIFIGATASVPLTTFGDTSAISEGLVEKRNLVPTMLCITAAAQMENERLDTSQVGRMNLIQTIRSIDGSNRDYQDFFQKMVQRDQFLKLNPNFLSISQVHVGNCISLSMIL